MKTLSTVILVIFACIHIQAQRQQRLIIVDRRGPCNQRPYYHPPQPDRRYTEPKKVYPAPQPDYHYNYDPGVNDNFIRWNHPKYRNMGPLYVHRYVKPDNYTIFRFIDGNYYPILQVINGHVIHR